MRMRLAMAILAAVILPSAEVRAQAVDAGRKAFGVRCARCHGADGNGAEMGPAIAQRLAGLDNQQLAKLIRDGVPSRGMPPSVVGAAELDVLVKFVRTLERRAADEPVVRMTVQTTDGETLSGIV